MGKTYGPGAGATDRIRTLARHLLGWRGTGAGFRALDSITMKVQRGQSMALIGVNGAGKSTLLKLIAGVVRASEGQVRLNGTVGALLELGAGFHPEYTGRQNIELGCALSGMTPAEIRQHESRIVEFADIGEHIDQPVKHYSTGMVVRLGFAVATARSPDLLITDEVLSVGDESFQRKCIAWMEEYLAGGGTLLLCSHSMYHVQKLCQQAAWIENGRVRRLGASSDVVREYMAWHEERTSEARRTNPQAAAQSTGYAVVDMRLNGQTQADHTLVPEAGDLIVEGQVHSPDDRRPQVAVGIVRADGTPVAGCYSEMDGFHMRRIAPHRYAYTLHLRRLPLLPGRYVARSHAMDPEGMRMFDHVEMRFDVAGRSRETGLVKLDHEWS